MPDEPYELEGEGPGDIRVRTVSGERRLIKSAAGFLAATAAKAIPAFRALTVADLPSGLTGIDFIVGTATGNLSAEIVAGTTPGGELGGTWATPTVDTTHSGSAHHDENHGASVHTNRTRRLWLPAGEVGADKEWIAAAGTPVFAQYNSLYGAMAFDAAAIEAVFSLRPLMIPDDYVSSLTIHLVWTNVGAGSGNVVWRVGHSVASVSGGTMPSFTTTDLTLAAPAQNVLQADVFSALTPSVAAGSLVNLSCGRIADNAADTLANDAGFLGYLVTYTADM